MMQRLRTGDANFSLQLKELLQISEDDVSAIELSVASILRDVQTTGDAAVLRMTKQFDRIDVSSMKELELSQQQMKDAFNSLPENQRLALEAAAFRVRNYHERQKQESGCHSWEYTE